MNTNKIFQTNPRLRKLLLVLIFTFAISTIVFWVLAQIQIYQREQLYIATEATLPIHREKRIKESNGKYGAEESIANWKIYRSEKYGFEFRYPLDVVLEPRFYLSEGWECTKEFLPKGCIVIFIYLNSGSVVIVSKSPQISLEGQEEKIMVDGVSRTLVRSNKLGQEWLDIPLNNGYDITMININFSQADERIFRAIVSTFKFI